MIIHVHRRKVSLGVWLDHYLCLFPALPMIQTLEDMDWRRRVPLLNERKNCSSALINSEASALESRLGDHDLFAPCLTGIAAEASLYTTGPEGSYHRAIKSNHNVG